MWSIRLSSVFLVTVLTLAPMPSDALFLKLVLCKFLKFDIDLCQRDKPAVAPAAPVAPVVRAPSAVVTTPTAISPATPVAPVVPSPTAVAPTPAAVSPMKAPVVPTRSLTKAPTKTPTKTPTKAPTKPPTKSPTRAPVGPAPAVRLNEFHYENTGSDTGEFIEVRALAGHDVSKLAVSYFGFSDSWCSKRHHP
jgi:hypothetical protein